MYRIKEAILVEGVYDKIKLSRFIDAVILVSNGFSIRNNKPLQKTIITMAEKTGLIILTDSDSAGIKIRNFVKQLTPNAKILHAYTPEIKGKEKRKEHLSKEGLLGVEGIDEDIIMNALRQSGATIDGEKEKPKEIKPITKADMFRLGLSGKEESAVLRQELAKKLGLPSKLSSNMLLDVINRLLTSDELSMMVDDINNS
ncbi:MAG: DUF4093 domain-containing protein [Clostridia bacterium]|nr:DUF4093 domain-containing protein [Clostridia bacterium]